MAKMINRQQTIPTDEEDLIAKYGPTALLGGASLVVGFILGKLTGPTGQGAGPIALIEYANTLIPKLNGQQNLTSVIDSGAALDLVKTYIAALETNCQGARAALNQLEGNNGTSVTQLLSRAGQNIVEIQNLKQELETGQKFKLCLKTILDRLAHSITAGNTLTDQQKVGAEAFGGYISWFLMEVWQLVTTPISPGYHEAINYINALYGFIMEGNTDALDIALLNEEADAPTHIKTLAQNYFRNLGTPLNSGISVSYVINSTLQLWSVRFPPTQ